MNEADVVIVGAGVAGSVAALVAARSGQRVELLDRATFPRYKTCGGGLIGVSQRLLGELIDLPQPTAITSMLFTRHLANPRTRHAVEPIVRLVDRADLDAALARAAVAAGATFHDGVTVKGVVDDGRWVTVDTSDGELRAGCVIGADGSASRIGGYVGARMRQVDLGLELELCADGHRLFDPHCVQIDWGKLRGSYGWVFPKTAGGPRLTVGVIAAKGDPQGTKDYLKQLVDSVGAGDLSVLHDSGHLTRCRANDSPLHRGRVILAGDAAGLLHPLTREGISFAVRSGIAAGQAAGDVAEDGETAAAKYAMAITDTLGEEMRVARYYLAMLEHSSRQIQAGVGYTSVGWRRFVRLCQTGR